LNLTALAALTEKLSRVEIHDAEGFVARHADTDIWQVPRNPRSDGGNVQKRVNVQKCRKKHAYLLFGKV
jgi:hypothetical protein